MDNKALAKSFNKPFDAFEGLEEIRLGKVQQGLGIGVDAWDNFIRWKSGQFNMVNGHDNVGKTDVILWYFVNMAKKHNKTFNIFCSENTLRSQVFKLFNFWTGRRMDKDFGNDEAGYRRTLNEITDCFSFIPTNKKYTANHILDIAATNNCDGLLIDPFNSLMVETGNKHQEDYNICSDIRLFCDSTSTTTFVNAHLVTQAARNVYPKDHDYEGHLKPPEKADTEGGQKFANRADDFWSNHRMTQHSERWKIAEVHVRKVKETITGGGVTPREAPIEMVWDDYTKYRIGGINPLQETYTGVGVNELEDIENQVRLEKSDAHSRMSRQSYGANEEIEKDEYEDDEIPF